ncbi:MAG: type 1 glutamine amidotransferase domain-containing protein [Alphaproteobacteria bacterium]
MTKIDNASILIIATHGFEQSELEVPRDKLRQAGATVHVASPDGGKIRGWQGKDWGNDAPVDLRIADADQSAYDALVLPGGQINPDVLRVDPDAIGVVRGFVTAGKPVAAICHAPWLLIEAGAVKGREATSYASLRTDMENAGAHWVDRAAVDSEGIITSRSPDDLDAFVATIVERIEVGGSRRAA